MTNTESQGSRMWSHLKRILDEVSRAVDWCIPEKLKEDTSIAAGVRMFIFSHLFGPFLGHTITLYILFERGTVDFAWLVFFGAVTAFWPFCIALRMTGWYTPLALVSIQNLIFCILWGCYHYGGMSSPILPWLVTVPLLAYFYLPNRNTRIAVSLLIFANLVAFLGVYLWLGFPDSASIDELSGLGFVSTFCAGTYVSMMALYYRNIVSSQGDLEDEVTRHLQTANQLAAATRQAEEAIQAKTEFLANMSHELRTPLNAIIGYSEILMDDTHEQDQQWEDLLAIHSAGKSLLTRINDLLDLAKLEAGKMELSIEEFAFGEFLDQVAAESGAAAAKKGLEWKIERHVDMGCVIGDQPKLHQLLANIIGNAVKFTEEGAVTLTASNVGGWLTMSVRDTGIGISAEELAGLFEAFSIRESETSSGYRDPALGLPLSKRLCTLMRGELTVESDVGRGSCFTVRLPADLTARSIPSRQFALAA